MNLLLKKTGFALALTCAAGFALAASLTPTPKATLDAATSENELVSAVWFTETSYSETPAYSNPGVFASMSIDYGENAERKGFQTLKDANNGGEDLTLYMPTYGVLNAIGKNVAPTEANAITFTLTPAENVYFKPTHLSFDGTRFGFGEGYFTVTVSDGTSTATAINYQHGARNNGSDVKDENGNNVGLKYTHFDVDLNGLSATSNPIEVKIYLCSFDGPSRSIGFANFALSGTVSGEVPETPAVTVPVGYVAVPHTGYLNWGDATLSNITKESDTQVGSTFANGTAVFSKLYNTVAQRYHLRLKTGEANADALVTVKIEDESGNIYLHTDMTVPKTGSWTPSFQQDLKSDEIPVGKFSLSFAVKQTDSSGYAGNWNSLELVPFTEGETGDSDITIGWFIPGTLALTDANVGGTTRYESGNNNIGYCNNNSYTTFSNVPCRKAGHYRLLLPMTRYGNGTIDITVTDKATNTTELNVTVDVPNVSNYNIAEFDLGNLTAGLKDIRFTNHTTDAWLLNFQAPTFAFVPDVAVELTSAAIGYLPLSDETVAALRADGHTATVDGFVFTEPLKLSALFTDAEGNTSNVTSTPAVSGNSLVYTFEGKPGSADDTYTLTVNGYAPYTPSADDSAVQLKANQMTKGDNLYTNGLYSLLNAGDQYNQFFKTRTGDFTITLPLNIKVKQIKFREAKDNYANGSIALTAVVSEGATSVIPSNNVLINSENRDITVNLADHQAGAPITFTLTPDHNTQALFWLELTVEEVEVAEPVALVAAEAIVPDNADHIVFHASFDREIANAEAALDGAAVDGLEIAGAEIWYSAWGLDHSRTYTLTLDVTDAYGNHTAEPVSITGTTGAPLAEVAKAAPDYIVADVEQWREALAAVNASNKSADAPHRVILVLDGDYDFGSEEQTFRCWNVSVIGESRDGVILHGNRTGISNPVVSTRYAHYIYLRDLTIRNDFDWGKARAGVGVALYSGDHEIGVNLSLQSQQDTQVTGSDSYYLDCDIYGCIDYICGGGNNYYETCRLIMTGAGAITAPSTAPTDRYGYVFDRCVVTELPGANSAGYTLGRPWQNEPRAYYLNTRMEVLPADSGWGSMSNVPTHFYEYNSMNADGAPLDLSVRRNSPTHTGDAYTPVLTAAQAAALTLGPVLGSHTSYLASDRVSTLPAVANFKAVRTADTALLTWDEMPLAAWYAVFADGRYLTAVTANTCPVEPGHAYTVRAADRMGALGLPTAAFVPGFLRINFTDIYGTVEMETLDGSLYTVTIPDGIRADWTITDGTADWQFGAPAGGTAPHDWEQFPCEWLGLPFTNRTTEETTVEFTYRAASDAPGSGIVSTVCVKEAGNIPVYFDNSATAWSTPHVHYTGGKRQSTFPGDNMRPVPAPAAARIAARSAAADIWEFALPASTEKITFTPGTAAEQSPEFDLVKGHLYNASADLGAYDGTTGVLLPVADPTNPADPDTDRPVYYNLQGVRVDNPAPGAYILIQNGRARKILLP